MSNDESDHSARRDMTRKELAAEGLRTRRSVLGDEYVDEVLADTTGFNQPLQDLLNEFCWGAVWGRKGLPLRDRSLVNLAMLTAQGRMREVAIHTRAALKNGVTPQQIAEVFIQAAVYCGVPVAADSFRAAAPVIQEMEIRSTDGT